MLEIYSIIGFLICSGLVGIFGSLVVSYESWFRPTEFEAAYLRFWPWPRLQLWFVRIFSPLALLVSLYLTIAGLMLVVA